MVLHYSTAISSVKLKMHLFALHHRFSYSSLLPALLPPTVGQQPRQFPANSSRAIKDSNTGIFLRCRELAKNHTSPQTEPTFRCLLSIIRIASCTRRLGAIRRDVKPEILKFWLRNTKRASPSKICLRAFVAKGSFPARLALRASRLLASDAARHPWIPGPEVPCGF